MRQVIVWSSVYFYWRCDGPADSTSRRCFGNCARFGCLFAGSHQRISQELQLLRRAKVAWWEEKQGKLHPWTRSNQVAFCNGKVYKITVTNLNPKKDEK